jgi:hypothetical protein
MAWLPLYMDRDDAGQLLVSLNADPAIAFIVADGPSKWIARQTLPDISQRRVCLWHVPSGPLPLLNAERATRTVDDPWAGWTELRSGADPTNPYFGAGHPGIVWWNVQIESRSPTGGIGLSSLEWIGNHYRIIGSGAESSTELWWAGLRKSVRKQKAKRIPRSGPIDGPRPEIWAFPSALAKITSGIPRDNNP